MKLKEAYIKAEKGNIYYTKNDDMFLSMVKSIFISKNIPVRVYYDTTKGLYVFGNGFDYIHADLATGMKYYSKIYGPDEMRANVSYLKQNCALFQVLPDDNFKKYDMGDGYTQGWFLKIDDLYFACRNKEFYKVRDNVPLFKNYIGHWIPTDYYIAKKQGLTESVEDNFNDNFWKWFGNSKVVDEQGKPLVVYHGWNKDFKEFILQDRDVKGMKCAFFSSDINTAGSYSEFGNVRDFYLRIENPYIYDAGNSQYYIGKDTNHIMKALSEAQKGNYDGVIVKNIRDDSYQEYEEGYELPYSTTYIVFNPNQIKSVDNNGNWSMTSNNINESVEEKILYIIRGVPGSGKSTLAHKLTDNVVEADQYFYDDKGNYNWSADKLNQAHNWCFNTVKKYMEEGRDKIAVANTFVKNKDYKRYVELAKEFGYKVDIRTCTGNYQNIHNVPDETVEKMRSKFQETPIQESVKSINTENVPTKFTSSVYEIKRYIENNKNIRIVYDTKNKWYFFNNSDEEVHAQILDDAISAGYYPNETANGDEILFGGNNGEFITLLIESNINIKDAESDGYAYGYVYNDFIIYDRYGDYRFMKLCKVLGKPNKILDLEDEIYGKNDLEESALNDKVFYTKQLSRMLNICLNIGNARFIHIPEANLYVIGDAHNNTHISLFISALNEGKFDIGENDIDEYFDEYINSAEDTGAIITKEYANDKNVWLKSPDSTNVINDYGKFYLCNGLCIEESLVELTNTEPKYVKRKSYLDESIAFVSKKDLSDIILKNPTRKELKEYGLEFCRYMFEDDNTYYFADAKEYCHLSISQLFLDIFKKYNLHTDGGYYSVKENCFYIRNDFGCEKCKERLDNTKLLHKLFGNFKSIIYEGAYPKKYEYYDKSTIGFFKSLGNESIIYASNDDKEELDESAENDKTLRDYAVKLANICLDALVKTKYETKIAGSQIQINVDKAFKKAVPMLKKSPYEYFILLVSKKEDKNASYGKTVDKKYGLITLPIFSDDPIDQTLSILTKHKAVLNRIYSTYHGDELKWKLNEYAIKYLKKEIEKMLVNLKSEYIDILIHECTHLIDDVRRTKTYKSKDQNLKDDKGIEDYYNSPEEQNAFYQETVSIFDNWAKDVGYKSFDIFFDDFIRQYKGEWNMLNEKNKRKLKKRAYAYWELYIKE